MTQASTKLKIAVFAPIPSASVNTAIAANAGDFLRIRNPYRISCRSVFIDTPLAILVKEYADRIPNGQFANYNVVIILREGMLRSCRPSCPFAGVPCRVTGHPLAGITLLGGVT